MTESAGERRLREAAGVPNESSRLSPAEQRLQDVAGDGAAADGLSAPGVDFVKPVYVISVAAELAGMHAQTLRQYDRLGLVTPDRTRGGGRRYSVRDIEKLRQVQNLSAEGVSLAGIQRIIELENRVEALGSRLREVKAENATYREALQARSHNRVFAAGRDGIVALKPGERPAARTTGGSLVLYRPRG